MYTYMYLILVTIDGTVNLRAKIESFLEGTKYTFCIHFLDKNIRYKYKINIR